MRKLEDIYPNCFFKDRHHLSWRVNPLCTAIQMAYHAGKVIELGASIGDLVDEFSRRGVYTIGIEGSRKVLKHLVCGRGKMHIQDLRLPLPDKYGRFELALCFEVAEHIEPEYVDVFIGNLTRLSDQLCMSICEGDGGRYHVNEQPIAYWEEKFAKKGYFRAPEKEKLIKEFLQPHCVDMWMRIYHDRLACFEKTAGSGPEVKDQKKVEN